jgi:hypothetical protein
MRKLLGVFISLLMIIFYSSDSFGQKIMKLDAGLKSGSTPIEAKRKGMSTVGKYEFGPFRIVSGKAGFTTTKSNKRFLSLETKSESKNKSSFVFVADGKDTVIVNTATNAKISESQFFNVSSLNVMNENYVAVFSTSKDTVVWRMILNSISGERIEGNFQAEGILTDGVNIIRIKAVKQWEDGKTPLMGAICGYEFIRDNNTLAAVQASIDTFQKKYVWLPQELNENMRLIFAAVSASLMVHADAALAAMD